MVGFFILCFFNFIVVITVHGAPQCQSSIDCKGPAPSYSVIEGHEECLNKYGNSSSEMEDCIPLFKPARCSETTWYKLATSLGTLNKKEVFVAPSYLSIVGYEKCLNSHVVEGRSFMELCLPNKKPEDCSKDAWQDLLRNFDGLECPALVGQVGAELSTLTPEQFLSKYENGVGCLRKYKVGRYLSEYCIPKSKPVLNCNEQTWTALTTTCTAVKCPVKPRIIVTLNGSSFESSPPVTSSPTTWLGTPAYLKIVGHESCLNTYEGRAGVFKVNCLPRKRPEDCTEDVWLQVSKAFEGITCPTQGVQTGAPAYLSVTGFKSCLGTYSPSSTYSEHCLPKVKPTICPDESWVMLQQVFDGVGCDRGNQAYLDVEAQKNCLGAYQASLRYKEMCLPTLKPLRCSKVKWEALKSSYVGVECPQNEYSFSGVGGLSSVREKAPKFFTIENFSDCLSEYRTEFGYIVNCLPEARPRQCPRSSWRRMTQFFEGDACPSEGADQLQETAVSIDLEFRSCMEEWPSPNGRIKDHCVPSSKPEGCPSFLWLKLLNGGGDTLARCSSSGDVVTTTLASTPAYLYVYGYEKCLRKQVSPFGNPNYEYCIPYTMPEGCSPTSWDYLQELFVGNECFGQLITSESLSLAQPSYLRIPGHQGCLSTRKAQTGTHSEYCLPKERPMGSCEDDSWTGLLRVFDGRYCDEYEPDYLVASSYSYCLRTFWRVNSRGWWSFSYCKPESIPFDCDDLDWLELQDEFPGQNCPEGLTQSSSRPPYISEEGSFIVYDYEFCLKQLWYENISIGGWQSTYCLPGVKPSDCDIKTHKQLRRGGGFHGPACRNEEGKSISLQLGNEEVAGSQDAESSGCWSLNGHEYCLATTWGKNEDGWWSNIHCMPAVRPSACSEEVWSALADCFNGETCSKSTDLENYEQCYETYFGDDYFWDISCLPDSRPDDCTIEEWELVSGWLEGDLSCSAIKDDGVSLYKQCLEDYWGEHPGDGSWQDIPCLPPSKPEGCSAEEWDHVNKKFVGGNCPEERRKRAAIIGGSFALPPKYLTVEGRSSCLKTYEGITSKHYCLPFSAPEGCTQVAYDHLRTIIFDEEQPSLEHFSTRTISVTVVSGKKELKLVRPAYLDVEGFDLCLETERQGLLNLSTYCMPLSRPSGCDELSWTVLRNIFPGRSCSSKQ